MSGTIKIGFEVFPPKAGTSVTFESGVAALASAGDYVSVTYGASGSGRERSEIALDVLSKNGLAGQLAAHLTAAGQSREEIDTLARHWKSIGVTKIVALRGDAPAESEDEYACAAALTEGLARIGGFDISVACYPETHPKSLSETAELDHLKRKFDAGATRAISQFFFEPDLFLRFRDRCAAAGLDKPIVPGLLPVASLDSLHRFAGSCGASVPDWIDTRFGGLEDDPDAFHALSIATTVSIAERLIAEGVDHIHLYTLNRVGDALTISRALGRIGELPAPPPAQTLKTEEAA